jgi:AAA-like domain
MSADRRGIRASTRHARAVYPFQAEAGLGWRGCLIGSDSSGGAFCFDPWELYAREVVANPNIAVFGELGYGKSALMKALVWRMLLFGRRAFVLDVKGEYAPLCAAVGVPPLRLAPGNGVCLNPLTARREPAAQVEILRAVARTAVGRPLSPAEAATLREALREVDGRAEGPRLRWRTRPARWHSRSRICARDPCGGCLTALPPAVSISRDAWSFSTFMR